MAQLWQDEQWNQTSPSVGWDDQGLVSGVVVVERMRTFNHEFYEPLAHIERFLAACQILKLEIKLDSALLLTAIQKEAETYRQQHGPEDCSVLIWISPGSAGTNSVCLIVHAEPLPKQRLAAIYQHGQPVFVSDYTTIPTTCWPISIKNRSRLNYWLADRDARQKCRSEHALGILKNDQGMLADCSIANLIILCQDGTLVTPPRDGCFWGLSIQRTLDIAGEVGIATAIRQISQDDLLECQAAFLTGSLGCLWRISAHGVQALESTQKACEIEQELQFGWSKRVGINYREQWTT